MATKKAKTRKTAKARKQFMIWKPNDRDWAMLDFLQHVDNMTQSGVVRMSLTERAERRGFALGHDSGNLREPSSRSGDARAV